MYITISAFFINNVIITIPDRERLEYVCVRCGRFIHLKILHKSSPISARHYRKRYNTMIFCVLGDQAINVVPQTDAQIYECVTIYQ